jgi:peptide/nickel transport system permease protein
MTADLVQARIAPAGRRRRSDWRRAHPVLTLVLTRAGLGVVTLFAVSIVIFLATQALPGNAATAVLGASATPERIAAIEEQLRLNDPLIVQYGSWIGGVLTGDLGTSFANGQPVWDQVAPRLANSAVLAIGAGLVGSVIAGLLGLLAAARRDSLFDGISSTVSLAVAALPEFVVAIALLILLSTNVLQLLPAVSTIPPGVSPLADPSLLVLPIATLAIVISPYMLRMMRAAMIEALESDYAEMAGLKGIARWRVLLVHAWPNALPPVIQVIGLNLLYLAGGIVVVENVFNYPGVGDGLVDAVANRDIPTIQFIVLVLAAFYVLVNVVTDVVALLASPRRRIPR